MEPVAITALPEQLVAIDIDESRPETGDIAVGVITFSIENSCGSLIQLKEWMNGIGSEVEQWKGYIQRDVILPPLPSACGGAPSNKQPATDLPVSIVLKFDNHENLRVWTASAARAEWLAKGHLAKLFNRDEMTVDHQEDNVFVTVGNRSTSTIKVAKRKKVLPPPKYRLWLLIWFSVFMAVLVTHEAGVMPALMHGGWLDFELALFIMLVLVVHVLIYACVPCIIGLRLGPLSVANWMRSPRWTPKKPPSGAWAVTVFAYELTSSAMATLSDGVELFASEPPAPPDASLTQRIHHLEGHVRALKKANYQQLQTIRQRTRGATEDGSSIAALMDQKPAEEINILTETAQVLAELESLVLAEKAKGGVYSSDDDSTLSIAIHHHIRWERYEEYKDWQRKIFAEMASRKGFVSSFVVEGEEEDQAGDEMQTSVIFRFATLESLQAWMMSPERKALVEEVQPMLGKPSQLEASRDRHLPDSFTDLFVEQSAAAPARPPPKWKIAMLTAIGLFFVVWPVSVHMPRHFERWGLESMEAQVFILSFINTFINVYGGAPFTMLIFGAWLKKPRPKTMNQPWRLLDEGLKSWWSQLFVTVLFFGACLLKACLGCVYDCE
jgi:antibiotic biosynthesis monooxygenase (ABM) superfamily enzyme